MKKKFNIKNRVVLIFMLTTAIPLIAQPITYDSSFNNNGRRICEYCPFYNYQHAFADVLLNPNQSIIGVGVLGGGRFVAKFKPNGLLDSSFGNHLLGLQGLSEIWFQTSPPESHTRAACLQTDGKILVCGGEKDSNNLFNIAGVNRNVWVMRLNADGFLDTTFGKKGSIIQPIFYQGLTLESEALDIGVLPDGKIVVCGIYFDSYPHTFVACFTPNGQLDSTFGTNGFAVLDNIKYNMYPYNDMILNTLKVLPSGSIIAAGFIVYYTSATTSSAELFISKFTSTGKLDSSFATNGFLKKRIDDLEQNITDIQLTPDGKIVFTGISSEIDPSKSIDSVISNYLVGRIDTNGAWDNTFNGVGYKVFNVNNGQYMVESSKIRAQADGKLVLMSTTYGPYMAFDTIVMSFQPSFARLNLDGSLDLSFNNNGYINLDSEPGTTQNLALNFVIQNDNKIIYCGEIIDSISGQNNSFIGRLHNYFSVGLNEPYNPSKINSIIYPNPVQNILNIEGDFTRNEAIKILNYLGQEVFCPQSKISNTKFTIETANLPQGMYYIKTQNAVTKFLKE